MTAETIERKLQIIIGEANGVLNDRAQIRLDKMIAKLEKAGGKVPEFVGEFLKTAPVVGQEPAAPKKAAAKKAPAKGVE